MSDQAENGEKMASKGKSGEKAKNLGGRWDTFTKVVGSHAV